VIFVPVNLKVKRYSSPEQVISDLWGITCHMESHSVTCHPTPGAASVYIQSIH